MKEVKDTLGIKYEQYSSIYNYDDEKLGKILKYLLWNYGKEVILQDLPKTSQNRIKEHSEQMENEIEHIIENDILFESIFNKITAQVSKSHRHWHILKENIENAKNKNKPTENEIEAVKIFNGEDVCEKAMKMGKQDKWEHDLKYYVEKIEKAQ